MLFLLFPYTVDLTSAKQQDLLFFSVYLNKENFYTEKSKSFCFVQVKSTV